MGSATMIDLLVNQAEEVRKTVNNWFSYEPIVVIGSSVLLTNFVYLVWETIPKDGAVAGMKRFAFKQIGKIPAIKSKIEEECLKAEASITEEVMELFQGKDVNFEFITSLPAKGLSKEEILEKLSRYMELGNFSWEDGAVSGTVYQCGNEITELSTRVYEMTAWTNPLHIDVFPGVVKMEAEVVRIVAQLFHGGPESCGSITCGGTESLVLAVKAYRDWGIHEKGIKNPEILVPVTAHAAFDKAVQILGITIKHVPVHDDTYTVDVQKMRKMITKNTVMLVGSAPPFPHGCIDDIEGVASLGLQFGIPVHVDACLGGFLIAFMSKAGYNLQPFDFRVKGVTSISADTHKYGSAAKGSSVLLFRDVKYKHYQYFVHTDWTGGLYATTTIAGSRPGAIIAGCWAALLFYGIDGYVDATKKIISTARYIQEKIRQIEGIYVLGKPEVSVIAMGSKEFDIYRLQAALNDKGWRLMALQFPPSIHICVTHWQTEDGVAERFVNDVQNAVTEILKSPHSAAQGFAAIYGTSQKIPDRSIVGRIAAVYLDKLHMYGVAVKAIKSN